MSVTIKPDCTQVTVQSSPNEVTIQTSSQEIALNSPTSVQVTPEVNTVTIGNKSSQGAFQLELEALLNQITLGYQGELSQTESELINRITMQAGEFDALVQAYTQLRTEVTTDSSRTASSLTQIQETISSINQSLAQDILSLESVFETQDGTSKATLDEIKRTISTKDSAMSERVNALQSEMTKGDSAVTAGLQNLQTTLATETLALSEDISRLSAEIADETSARKATIDEVKRTITNEKEVLAESVSALRSEMLTETSKVDAAVQDEKRTRVTEMGALSETVHDQRSSFETAKAELSAQIGEVSRTVTNQEESVAEEIKQIKADFKTDLAKSSARIDEASKTATDASGSVAQATKELTAKFDSVDGALKTHGAALKKESEARADQFGALSSDIETLTAGSDTEGSIAEIVSKKFTEVSDKVGSLSTWLESITATGEGADDSSIASIVESAVAQVSKDLGTTVEDVKTLLADDGEGSLAKLVTDLQTKINTDVGVVAKRVDTLTANDETEGSVAKILSDALVQVNKDIGAVAKDIKTLVADDQTTGSIAQIVQSATVATSTEANEYADEHLKTAKEYADDKKTEAVEVADGYLKSAKKYADDKKTEAIAHADNKHTAAKKYADDRKTEAVKHANDKHAEAKTYADGIYADALEADTQASAALETKLTTKIDTNAVAIKLQQTNLLDLSAWKLSTLASSPVGESGMTWSLNGRADENEIILGEDPHGETGHIWKAYSQDGSASGGWNTNVPIDHTKTYRSSVWIKKVTNRTDGSTYFGCHGSSTKTLNGSDATNPYFWSGDLPEANKWYLLIGVIHGSGYTDAYSGVAGLYDPVTGKKIQDFTEFKNKVDAEVQRHRAYLYYPALVGTVQYFARPRFEEINSDTQGLTTLLGGKPFLDKLNETYSEINEQRVIVDGIAAAYTLELDVNGKVSGFGSYNDGRTSAFNVVADKFSVSDPESTDTVIFGTDEDGTFYATNLEIRDSDGNAILSAGKKISADIITGLGDLATKSTVSTSEVTGLGTLATKSGVSTSEITGLGKLATKDGVSTSEVTGLGTLATKNGITSSEVSGLGTLATKNKVANTDVTGLGKMALIDKISSSTSATYIAEGAIGSALIGEAAIGNAHIDNLNASKITAGTIKADRLSSDVITAKVTKVDWSIIENAVIDTAVIKDGAISNAKIGNVIQSTAKAGDGKPKWKLDKEGGIEARSITIYNDDGTVLMQSGGKLNVAAISGLGSFATASSIKSSDVSGLGTLATKDKASTSDITGLGDLATKDKASTSDITGLGSLATKNSVTTTEVSGLGKLATKDKAETTDITGLGGLATKDSVSYDSVTGTKPPSDADATNYGDNRIKNSRITIGANGKLNNAGGGQVTTAGIGAETPAGAQSKADSAQIKAIDATSNYELVASGSDMYVKGNVAGRSVDHNSWDGQVYSAIPYTGGCILSFKVNHTGRHVMVGLNTDPTANASYTSIDYAFYMLPSKVHVYESGSGKGDLISGEDTNRVFTLVYDGTDIFYFINGTLKRHVKNVGADKKFYVDSSFHSHNEFKVLQWSAYTNTKGLRNSEVTLTGLGFTGDKDANKTTNTNQLTDGANLGKTATWSNVSGTGKPADGADVTSENTAKGIANQGNFATLDKIVASNVSTYIAGAAIGNAQIGNAAITNAKIDNLAVTSAKLANAAVDTLQIKGQAVTVPTYLEGAQVSTTGTSAWVTVLDQTVDYSTAVNAFCSFVVTARRYKDGTKGFDTYSIKLELFDDTTLVKSVLLDALEGDSPAVIQSFNSVPIMGGAFIESGKMRIKITGRSEEVYTSKYYMKAQGFSYNAKR